MGAGPEDALYTGFNGSEAWQSKGKSLIGQEFHTGEYFGSAD